MRIPLRVAITLALLASTLLAFMSPVSAANALHVAVAIAPFPYLQPGDAETITIVTVPNATCIATIASNEWAMKNNTATAVADGDGRITWSGHATRIAGALTLTAICHLADQSGTVSVHFVILPSP